MGNYAGLEICLANLSSPPSSSLILSYSVSPTSVSEFLIIGVVLSLFISLSLSLCFSLRACRKRSVQRS